MKYPRVILDKDGSVLGMKGITVSSGIGDGVYTLSARYNKHDEIVGLELDFLVEKNANRFNWQHIVVEKLFQTRGIDNAIQSDSEFEKEITSALGKYQMMNWGDTCKEDSEMNNNAVYSGDERVVAKYTTSKGDVFIITEWDRSATTILFACEY